MTRMHLIALAILLVGIAAFGFVRLETRGPADDLSLPLSDDQVSGAALIETTAASPLSDLERAGLVFMREEEKLARDVYALLGERTPREGRPVLDSVRIEISPWQGRVVYCSM